MAEQCWNNFGELFVQLHELSCAAGAPGFKMTVRQLWKQESIARQQGALPKKAAHGKSIFDKYMLQIGGMRHQVCNASKVAGGVLGGHQIRNGICNAPVLPAGHNALGAGKVVMEKLAVGKLSADALKEGHHLAVGQS